VCRGQKGLVERSRKNGEPAALHHLMTWMTTEMKSRMRATAPLGTRSNHHAVNYVTNGNEGRSKVLTFQCWPGKRSTHWPDQCLKFASLSLDERLNISAALKEREQNIECPTVAEEHNVQKR